MHPGEEKENMKKIVVIAIKVSNCPRPLENTSTHFWTMTMIVTDQHQDQDQG